MLNPELELSSVRLPLDAGLPGREGARALRAAVARTLGVSADDVKSARLLKRSVDARKKRDVHFVATLAVVLADGSLAQAALDGANVASGAGVKVHVPTDPLVVPELPLLLEPEPCRPVVVGAGPAGLFAALYLAEAGLRPLLFERGANVDERMAAVEDFAAGGPLDTRTNIQFGEGGAGTFSDGKLNTGTKSPHIRHVLQAFVDAGAPDEILWQAKPHIGTDKLADVVRNIRNRIVEAGGEVRFLTQVTGLRFEGSRLRAVEVRSCSEDGPDFVELVPTRCAILACGHSARDTFAMLRAVGVAMERKPFAVGVRIEHPQKLIDETQYGAAAGHPALGAADYKLAVHLPDGRGVYTFCMCPGGEVVAATSEEGGVCVNGMSRFARDGANANSALLVEVRPDDVPGDDVLAGVEFQRELERAAYALAEGDYRAPAQRVGEFLGADAGRGELASQESDGTVSVDPTYPRGVTWCDLHECLPEFVAKSLERALPLLDRKLRGFAHPQAVMTAVEARSSSPVRMLRGADMQSVSHRGLYPCGEGAGYAGGITSAAVDGLRVAEAVVSDVMSVMEEAANR